MSNINPDILWLLKTLNSVYPPVKIDEITINVWQMVLKDLTRQEFEKGLTEYLRCDNPFFPRPGQIYSLARPKSDTEGEAMLLTDKIFACSFGPDEFNMNRARESMGEIAWAYIQNQGGWPKFCHLMQTTQEKDIGMFKAHTRKAIVGLMQRKLNGQELLGGPTITLKSLGLEMKQIPYERPIDESH